MKFIPGIARMSVVGETVEPGIKNGAPSGIYIGRIGIGNFFGALNKDVVQKWRRITSK